MKWETLTNPLDEPVLTGRTATGLRVIMNPRPDWVRTFAAFGVNFGSVDRVGGTDGEPVPEGLAHFLEHKLFEDERGDVSDRFAALGASTNAMTGFTGTTYISSTIADPEPCLDLLLDFVQEPWFTDELVEKEQGIIAQEIRMYDDDPDWRVFFGLLGCLYRSHPVKDNIAGSVESIAEIDAATLRHCYDLFYHPNNLCLVVSGPMDPERVAALVERDQGDRPEDSRAAHQRGVSDEPRDAIEGRCALTLPVSRPRLLMGIKETVLGGSAREQARRKLATRVALDLLLGRSSPGFESLYQEGLVDESFGVSYSSEAGFGFTTLGGDTDEPERLEQRIWEILGRSRTGGLDVSAFERVRNKLLGSMLRSLDSPESVAYQLLNGAFRGEAPFEALAILDELTPDDLLARLEEHVREEARAVAVVHPTGG